MSVISSWNVRGFNAIAKHMDLRTFITDRKIGLMSIVETHVLACNKDRIQHSVFRSWHVVDNYEYDDGGRIWLAWDPAQFTVSIISKSAQAIFANVCLADGSHFVLTVVYGFKLVP